MTPSALIGRRVVGNYVIESLLGEGGMGAVYLARHVVIDAHLAVKVLHPALLSRADIVRRFVAEAKAASDIKHPNIIRVIDVGQLESGEHYIALEYLEGYSLDRVAPPLPLEVVLAIVCQVASGLDAAHARGIIHRDLKPGNLFVSPQPANPYYTKILDFGIAKLIGDTEVGGVHTGTNMVMGTPAYMAPEQARGSANVTPLSDVYALGAIVFELVCAQRPYAATTIGDIVHQQLTLPAPDPGRLRPDLPAGWCEVISAALSFQPGSRPQSAGQLAELLAAATPGGFDTARQVGFMPTGKAQLPAAAAHTAALGSAAQPTTLSAGAGVSQAPAASMRMRWGVAAGLVGGLALAGGLAAWLTKGPNSSAAAPPPVPAVQAAPDADAQAATAASAPRAADAGIATARVRIEVQPVGASIYIDGEAAGPAPLEVERPSGLAVQVRVEAPGYAERERTVVVGANEIEQFTLVPAKPSPPEATPAGAGRKPGSASQKPPTSAWEVPEGDDPFAIQD